MGIDHKTTLAIASVNVQTEKVQFRQKTISIIFVSESRGGRDRILKAKLLQLLSHLLVNILDQ